jgi:hypothetical protein
MVEAVALDRLDHQIPVAVAVAIMQVDLVLLLYRYLQYFILEK